MSSLYILDINTLSYILFANIFSQSVSCLFILLIVSFALQKLFSFIYSYLLTFASGTFAFDAKSKESLPRPILRRLPPIFFEEFLWFQIFTCRSLIHFEFIFVSCKKVIQFHSFGCSFPVFPSPFV